MNRKKIYHRVGLGVLVGACLTYGQLAFAQIEKPQVSVDFVIDAALYRDEMPSHVDSLESQLAESIVDRLSKPGALHFVGWVSRRDPGADTALASIRLMLEGRPQSLGTEVRLHYFGRIGGGEEEQDLADEAPEHFNAVVFGALDQKHAQSPRGLLEALNSWLDDRITDTHTTALKDRFLTNVPVATDIQLDVETNRLVVPLRYASFHPSPESRLRANFASTQHTEAFNGNMNLQPLGGRPTGEQRDVLLECLVNYFNYDEELPDANAVRNRWTQIRDVLDKNHLVRLQLFVDVYVKDHFTGVDDDGFITDDPSM